MPRSRLRSRMDYQAGYRQAYCLIWRACDITLCLIPGNHVSGILPKESQSVCIDNRHIIIGLATKSERRVKIIASFIYS